jgi:DNA-binding LacI/PurR family transcriptional regulator
VDRSTNNVNGFDKSMAVTIRDVARVAGVSKTTASYILNEAPHFKASEETRSRVLDIARDLGYRRNVLAAALSSGRIYTFGVFLPSSLASSQIARLNIYHKDMLTAIVGAASRAGFRIMPLLVDTERTISEQEITDQRIDGVLVTFPASSQTFEMLQRSRLPCVFLSSGQGPYIIEADDRGGMRLAVEHLVSLGHRRIVHFTNIGGSSASKRRIRGFEAAIQDWELGQPVIVHHREEVVALLRKPLQERPTAFTAYSDQWAFHILDVAQALGLRVPDHLSVVGFDDGPISVLARPELTTIYNPLDEIADAGIALLDALCRKENPVLPPPIPTRLVIRHSTAPPSTA